MTEDDYLYIIDACGGQYTPVPRRECSALLRGWREVYAAGLFAATGRWSYGGLEWHVFSFQHAEALCGDPAVTAYGEQTEPAVVIFPQERRLSVVRLVGGTPPDFRALRADVLVWPEDLSWTMAFTHEESLGLGPYFSRREWQGPGSERPTGRTR